MKRKANRQMIVTVCRAALLLAAAVAVVVASRNRRQPAPPPKVPVSQTSAEVRVKAVERKAEPVSEGEEAAVSGAVAIVCGEDAATADRYEARNDALRSIARWRDLEKGDVDALLAYLRSQDDNMRVERVAALKNDVMNLLRNQEPPVEGLAETLIAMIEGRPVAGFGRSGRDGVPPPAAVADGTATLPARSRDTDGDGTPSLPGNTIHPPAVIDYCIQHLGAMLDELDDQTRVGALGDRALPDGGARGVCPSHPFDGTRLGDILQTVKMR